MNKDSKIYVAGASGLVGSAIVRELRRKGYERINRTRINLARRGSTESHFRRHFPEYVFNAAAHAGGIKEAIAYPAEMLYDNAMIQACTINACFKFKVKKLINLSSSCVYPVSATQPYVEESLGDGKTDENWSYAIAKLAGTELCRAYHKQYGCNFMTVIPCNMYGYNDNFDLEKAHVIPALIRKFHESDTVEVWGHGPNATRVHHRNGGGYYTPHREFLWVDDFAEAVVMLMENHDYDDLYNGVINIGSGHEIQISQLVEHLKHVIGDRKIVWNGEKPQGVKSKLLDSSRLKALGWSPKTPIVNGLKKLNEWYLRGKNENRACN
ncbi:MAG: NAD-dependent epimerase/dehydratase family protein [Planctomycetota bacterium]|jgi:GDP-L-fucose synthase